MNAMASSRPMEGEICLVTGATAGIGKVTATALASQGAQVVIAGRDEDKTRAVCQEIVEATGNKLTQYLLADFSDLQQVRDLADAYQEQYSRLDVLINNAGAFFNARHETPYGVEKTFLVNHLAPFLLTILMLDLIQQSAPARIINLSSEAHRQDNMDFDDLSFEKGYLGIKAYGRSKLANILFTYELGRQLGESKVTVNAIHPGHVATDIWKNDFGFFGPALKKIMGLFSLTPEEGADNSIYLATSPEVKDITGKYFLKHQPADSSEISYDVKTAQRLWEISADLVGLD